MFTSEASSDYIEEIFNVWLEQKIIREISHKKMFSQYVWDCDLKSVELDIDNQLSKDHELLEKPAAAKIMGEAGTIGSVDLRHFIQTLIGIQEDPHLQIRKLASELAKSYSGKGPFFVGISGSMPNQGKFCELVIQYLQEEHEIEAMKLSPRFEEAADQRMFVEDLSRVKSTGIGSYLDEKN